MKPEYGYHAVMGPDGLFHSAALTPGTMMRDVEGNYRIFLNGEWLPWSVERMDAVQQETNRKIAELMKMPIDAEVLASLMEPPAPRFHFTGF